MTLKDELRKQYRQRRKGLSLQQMHEALAFMQEHFRQVPMPPHPLVMTFKAMRSKQEVDPGVFEHSIEEESGGRGFCYPSVDIEKGQMYAYLDDDRLQWTTISFGLQQPISGTLLDPTDIDVILVPLLAFDEQGHRLGYGKGFYDRFLKDCRPDALKIGLSWFEAETALPEIGAHDVPLNYCVTPHRLYVF